MKRDLSIPILIIIGMIISIIYASYYLNIVFVFIPALLVALVVYLNTFYKYPPSPEKLLPLYLVALALQLLHFGEEYVCGFDTRSAALLGQEPYSLNSLVIFNMVAYGIFILGAIAIFKKSKPYLVIAVAFIVIGVILNSIVHILTSLFTGGYFPGLFTAILYLGLIPSFIKIFKSG